MPITIGEILADIPEAVALYTAAQAGVAALPAPPAVRTAADYAKAFGAADGSALALLAALIDALEVQAKS